MFGNKTFPTRLFIYNVLIPVLYTEMLLSASIETSK
jgi:hypothetical protein